MLPIMPTTKFTKMYSLYQARKKGAQWLSGRVLDSRPRGRGFESHRRHCVVSLSKNINPSLVLVQPKKTLPFITERLLMGRKESNQTNKLSSKMAARAETTKLFKLPVEVQNYFTERVLVMLSIKIVQMVLLR